MVFTKLVNCLVYFGYDSTESERERRLKEKGEREIEIERERERERERYFKKISELKQTVCNVRLLPSLLADK